MKKLSLLFLTVMLGMGVFAQTTYSWRSQATNGNWNVANNWWNGSTTEVPTGGEILKIENDIQLTMTNDLSVTNRHQIIFTQYATKSRTITGTTENTFNNFNNDVNKKPKIENNSSATQTIDFPLKAGADFELNPNSGDLIISGTYNRNGKTTKVSPNTTTTKTLCVKNSFTGSGDIYLLNGSTMSVENGGSITGGTLYVENGTLSFSGTGNLSSTTDVRISKNKVMNLNNINVTVKSVAERGYSDGGTISLGSGTLTMEGGWEGTIYQNSISGSGSIVKKGTGVLSLYGTQNYSGTTSIEGGSISISSNLTSSTITVKNGGTLNITENLSINNLTIETGGTLNIADGKTLTINAGKQVTINGTVNYNETGKIKLLSDATNGTATLTGDYGGPGDIQQHLNGGRQWWYLSSPVSAAQTTIFNTNGNKIGYYNEGTATYTNPITATESMTVGKGYVVKLANTLGDTYTFTGGNLNNGDIDTTFTRTGIENPKRGFHLIGNPYPSYIDWDLLYDPASASNMRNAIWFRTWNGTAMDFHTYSDGDGVPNQASGKIAPMQGFWVKVHADGSNGSLTFKNEHRSHKAETGYNPLKVKAADDRQRVRLVLSDGTNSDETLIVGKSYASDSQDAYDIEKMSNESADISEIYSMIGTEAMVINSVAPITAGKTVALGIRSTSEKAYSITASQLQNISTDVRVVLVDAEDESETELSEGVSYNFVAPAGAVNNRFSIQFRSPGATTLVDNDSKNKILVYSNSQQQIEIISTESLPAGTQIRVFNAAGQTIAQMQAAGNRISIPASISKGVYFCHIENTNQNLQYKVIVR